MTFQLKLNWNFNEISMRFRFIFLPKITPFSVFFYPREKSKATREKNQKKCPWKKKVPVKIFLKFHPWNLIWCPWKKLKNVPVKGGKCAWKNFIDRGKYNLGFNFSMGSRYYFGIGVRENYIFWKKIPTREKNQICTRETEFSTHEKKAKECPWKK